MKQNARSIIEQATRRCKGPAQGPDEKEACLPSGMAARILLFSRDIRTRHIRTTGHDMLSNFSFLIPGVLAGSALPGFRGPLALDLAQARAAGIRRVVTLTEDPLPAWALEQAGLAWLHLPIIDFAGVEVSTLERFVRYVDEARTVGEPVLVHCFAGQGRTGTCLAAYLVHQGLSPEEAIAEVRRQRPASIDSLSQERSVYAFATSRHPPESPR